MDISLDEVRYLRTGIKMLLGSGVLFYGFFQYLQEVKKYYEVPLSKIRSISAGGVRVKGTATIDEYSEYNPIPSNFLNKHALSWIVTIDDYYWGSVLRGWRCLASRGDWTSFCLDDGSGKILVDHEGKFRNQLNPAWQHKIYPFKKVSPEVVEFLKREKIDTRMNLFGMRLPINKIMRLREFIINEGDECEIKGCAMPLADVRMTDQLADQQSQRLIIANQEGAEMTIRSLFYNLKISKGELFFLILAMIFFSGGLAFISVGYNIIGNMNQAVILSAILGIIGFLSIINYYKQITK